MHRFVGGWRLLTQDKWIVDMAMVINQFNHKFWWVAKGDVSSVRSNEVDA